MKEIAVKEIENQIFTIRGLQVMIDRDLAEFYKVETKVLNQAVKRNLDRFPDSFRFSLSKEEKLELVTNCDRFASLKHSTSNPNAFTEQGVAMLSAVLHSSIAVQISIHIMNAFVDYRKNLLNSESLIFRMNRVENKLIEGDKKFDQLFLALEKKETLPEKGIFFEGQVYDAYDFVTKLIKKAEKEIILIDNYIDDTVLTMFTKRKRNVAVTIYTKNLTKELSLDLEKHNSQYPPIDIKDFKDSHDRFLLLDGVTLYHIGASLKDLGKNWVAFSRMDSLANGLLEKLK